MARRRSRRRAIIEARRQDARRALVAGAGLLVFAAFGSMTGVLPTGLIGIAVVLGIGLLVFSAILARRYS